MKRCLALALALLMILGLPAAQARQSRLVDWINQPQTETDFAFDPEATLLEIVFPQVLNADAMLLRCGEAAILVDCASAKQASRVTAMLEELGVDRLDAIINTHPHYDHLQGLEKVAGAVAVDRLYLCFPEGYNKHVDAALEAAQRLNIPVSWYGDGDVYDLGAATLTAWCKADERWNCNARCAVLKARLGEATALLTGDILLKTQKRLLEVIPPEELDVDVLKYPHHGLNKLDDDFCDALSPLLSVITNNGTKGGPARRYLKGRGVPYAITVPGYVSLTTDGETWLAQRLTPGQAVDADAYADAPQEE